MTDFHSRLMNWRRYLHERPELGYEETETSDFIARRLAEFRIEVSRGIGKTGVVGILEGRPGRKAIALRVEMDGLPIREQSGKPYASKIAGRMHACGHDGHIAMLLGAAENLARSRDFNGTVYLIFQPAEETGGGARAMMEDGLLERFPFDEVYSVHNWPGLEEGRFAMRSGAVMAASDQFDILLTGKGCHAGMPHQGRDPILAATAIVSALQPLTNRLVAPWEAAVLSVTRLGAGNTYNVIPETAELAGTIRTLSPARRKTFRERLRRVARNVGAAHGIHAKVTITPGYPVTINTAREVAYAAAAAVEVSAGPPLGDLPPSMATEDFSYMLERRPGCYAWLGAGSTAAALHSDVYDFNDALLPMGVAFWTELVKRRLPA